MCIFQSMQLRLHSEAETTPFELIETGIERILFIDDEEMLAEMGQDYARAAWL